MKFFLDVISPRVDWIELKHVIISNKIDSKTSIKDLINFCLSNFFHQCHTVRIACVEIFKRITIDLIAKDALSLVSVSDRDMGESSNEDWHILQPFAGYLEESHKKLGKYIEDFR